MRKGLLTPLIGLVVLVGAAGTFAYTHHISSFDPRSWFRPAVAPTVLMVSGDIEAHESVLSFKTIQSHIVDLPFDEGQWVKAGTPLARADDTDYAEQVAIANAALDVQQRQLAVAQQNVTAAEKTIASDQADLAQKQLDFTRAATLLTQGAGTTEARDQADTALKQSSAILDRDQALRDVADRNVALAQANIRSAEENIKMAKITQGDTRIEAPYDGVILVRQAELGGLAIPGSPVVTMADLDHVWLRAYVNETDLGAVRPGEAVTVTTDTYPGHIYQGRIGFISSTAEFTPKTVQTYEERVTLVYRIRIDLDNPSHELLPGMPADAEITLLPPAQTTPPQTTPPNAAPANAAPANTANAIP